mmetsp:Transcript_60918/g.132139  ORF Transcript_60918/g.132139 Transcript_60918/m.132139 type:complete len:284 (-) Transcript_60918:111-962(-)
MAKLSGAAGQVPSSSVQEQRKSEGKGAPVKSEKAPVEPHKVWLFRVAPALSLILLLAQLLVSRRKVSMRAGVQVLTVETFDDFVAARPEGVLVNFHTKGCSHCLTLAPEFEAAAANVSIVNASFASVDAEAEAELAKKHGVHRYPSVLWFRKGRQVQELPPTSRSASKISDFVSWLKQTPVVEFESRPEFDEAVVAIRETLHAKAPPVFVAFGSNAKSNAAFEHNAEVFRGKSVFLHVKDASEEKWVLRAYSREAEADEQYEGKPDVDEIHEWMQGLLRPAKS